MDRGRGAAQHGGSESGRERPRAAHDPRGAVLRVVRVAGVDPLRGEGDEDVLADHQPTCGQRLDQQVPGGADIGGGGEHQQLAGDRVGDGGGAGAGHGGEVGDLVAVDRRGHADDHGGCPGEFGRVVGQGEDPAVEVLGEPFVVARQQVDLAPPNGFQASTADVESDHLVPCGEQGQGGGQAHIAETDHGDGRLRVPLWIGGTDAGRQYAVHRFCGRGEAHELSATGSTLDER